MQLLCSHPFHMTLRIFLKPFECHKLSTLKKGLHPKLGIMYVKMA